MIVWQECCSNPKYLTIQVDSLVPGPSRMFIHNHVQLKSPAKNTGHFFFSKVWKIELDRFSLGLGGWHWPELHYRRVLDRRQMTTAITHTSIRPDSTVQCHENRLLPNTTSLSLPRHANLNADGSVQINTRFKHWRFSWKYNKPKYVLFCQITNIIELESFQKM